MILFGTAFLLAIAIALVFFVILKTICLKELALIVGAQFVVALVSALISYYSATDDVQVFNSYVTGKEQVRVSCRHSYSCRCRQSCSGTGKNRSCHQVCDTCYEHSNDWDWHVYDAIGQTYRIQTIDRRGANEPPRWTRVQMGEPTSVTSHYENYVKAAPGSLFRTEGAIDENTVVPNYPQDIYDYYRLDRLVTVGFDNFHTAPWNSLLSELNAEMGSLHQVNVIAVVTKDKPEQYFYALRQAWLGGKKNDVILVVNVDSTGRPTWANAMAWVQDPLFIIKLRDAVMALPTIEPEPTIAVIRESLRYYKRKPMEDYAYLKSAITPSTTAWIVTLLLQLLLSGGLIYLCHKNELFQTRRYY